MPSTIAPAAAATLMLADRIATTGARYRELLTNLTDLPALLRLSANLAAATDDLHLAVVDTLESPLQSAFLVTQTRIRLPHELAHLPGTHGHPGLITLGGNR